MIKSPHALQQKQFGYNLYQQIDIPYSSLWLNTNIVTAAQLRLTDVNAWHTLRQQLHLSEIP